MPATAVKSITVKNLPTLPEPQKSQRWYGLPGVSRAYYLYQSLLRSGRFALIITKDAQDTEEWYNSLRFFTGDSESTNSAFSIMRFPDTETLPYDHFSTHPDIVSDRLLTLHRLQQRQAFSSTEHDGENPLSNKNTAGVCLVSASTLLARLCPVEHVNKNSLVLKIGDQLNVKRFTTQLVEIGYQHRETVYEHGEFAVRGSLLDVFPMGSEHPYRIELFDTEVDSLRTFDPESQRSDTKIDGISILPAGEIALDIDAINHFRDRWHMEFQVNSDICPVYQDTVSGVSSAGIEAYLPMFYQHTSNLLDYLPEQSLIVRFDNLKNHLTKFYQEVVERHEQNSIDPTRPLLNPSTLYLQPDECLAKINQFSGITVYPESNNSATHPSRGEFQFKGNTNPDILLDEHSDDPIRKIKSLLSLNNNNHDKIIFCVASAGRREVFIEKLKQGGINAHAIDSWAEYTDIDGAEIVANSECAVALTTFNHGANFPIDHSIDEKNDATKLANVYVFAEAELFGVTLKPKAKKDKEKNILADATIHSLLELSVGSPIVHIEHGVGRYRGLEHMPVPIAPQQHIDAEFLVIEYSGGDKLYVPVTSLHLISRYMGGDEVTAPLNKLGSESWGNVKKKAITKVHDVAAELLAIYAKRKSLSGYSHDISLSDYDRFSAQFPFEETVDQQSAIDAVISDMQAAGPMDRLVCGDVGFGKTEVAMRAAFVSISNDKQVMMLVPTTLLAQQHFQNFQDRFSDWPVKVDTLSRFRTQKEQDKVNKEFTNGQIDILIGTHKLLQKSIVAKSLGLVIVDEEHRFGVRQKEQLKRLCADVDLLTMTATPIPRTLNMAMAGLRDLSIITTPPARRLSVKTFVQEKQNSVIKEAMLRELLRGGQIFYLHNDVKTIEKTAGDLQALVPDARIVIGHGQLPERALEQVMSDFYHKKYNVLVCTTIIETGIDIPNANTIIIDRADKFGLAQLHQLRGRVGRSHHQAYAYLFTPNRKVITKEAEKRLTAIEEAQDLGAGFMLATHDLEIRGAGELLGDDQSGQIHSIGYSLYIEMLDKAVAALQAGEEIDLNSQIDPQGEINLHLPALIPDKYLPDIHNRLLLYKRIANASGTEQLRDLKVEMIDRFGLLTDEINYLFAVTEIKQRCAPIGVRKIDAGQNGGYIEFTSKTTIDPIKIVMLVQSSPDIYKLVGATRLSFKVTLTTAQQRIDWVNQFIDQLLQS